MLLSDFNYNLPAEQIAQRPLGERDASRMLILDRSLVDHKEPAWEDSSFRSFPERLRGDELIVVNNARVIPVSPALVEPGLLSDRPTVS